MHSLGQKSSQAMWQTHVRLFTHSNPKSVTWHRLDHGDNSLLTFSANTSYAKELLSIVLLESSLVRLHSLECPDPSSTA